MSSENNTNVLEMLDQDHKFITDYISTFSEKLKTRDKDFFEGLKAFIGFLETQMTKHFEAEEAVYFPAGILGAPAYDTTMMIMKLQKDHGDLERQLQSVIETGKKPDFSIESLTDTTIELVKGFFNQLRIHVKREMIELYPMVNENPRSRALLKTYAEEFKNRPSGEPEPF